MDGYNKVSILFLKFGQDNLSIICRKDVHGHSLLLIFFSVYQTPTHICIRYSTFFQEKSLHALDKEPKNLSMQGVRIKNALKMYIMDAYLLHIQYIFSYWKDKVCCAVMV